MEGGGVIDTIAHVSDDPAALPQGENDPVLLRGVYPAEQVHILYPRLQGLIVHLLEFRANHYADDREIELFANMPCHQFIIASHDLDCHASMSEPCQCLLSALLRRVEKRSESGKDQFRLIAHHGMMFSMLHALPGYTEHPEAIARQGFGERLDPR